MILIDDTEASLELFNSTKHYFGLVFARSVFSPDLLDKFISQKKMNDFDVLYFMSHNQNIKIIKPFEERCMKLVVIDNPTDLIIK